jgi:hypothetical protein
MPSDTVLVGATCNLNQNVIVTTDPAIAEGQFRTGIADAILDLTLVYLSSTASAALPVPQLKIPLSKDSALFVQAQGACTAQLFFEDVVQLI